MAEKNQEFSRRLKAMLAEKGISQASLADSCGITKPIVTKYTKHGGVPEWHILIKITQLLNTTTDFLLTGQKPASQPLPAWLKKLLPLLESLPPAGQERLRAWVEGYAACLGDIGDGAEGGASGPATEKSQAEGGV